MKSKGIVNLGCLDTSGGLKESNNLSSGCNRTIEA